jgi:LmbE family N-acetylglucosaminyl deacetylase
VTESTTPALGRAHAEDIYLSPHSDDICYSLGILALRRRAGTLLTVFPVTSYSVSSPRRNPAEIASVTRLRKAEDAEFAAACGMRIRYLGFSDALTRGYAPFTPDPDDDIPGHIEAALVDALLDRDSVGGVEPRPMLFCPSGIGGHVDHRAVRDVVLRHFTRIEARYRIAFYEDLYYASDPARRETGLAELFHAAGNHSMQRGHWVLDEADQASKMHLVRLYASQLTPRTDSIAAYTPADEHVAMPHEAVWMCQPERTASCGAD